MSDSPSNKWPDDPRSATLLPDRARDLLTALHTEFQPRIDDLLLARNTRQQAFDAGERPEFAAATEDIRTSGWQIGEIPDAIRAAKIEVIGQADSQAVCAAFDAGANSFVIDLEEIYGPTWHGRIDLQLAVNKLLANLTDDSESVDGHAAVWIRPRGLHRKEESIVCAKESLSAAIFDVGLFVFHNGSALRSCGQGCYFSLPGIESHFEAEVWRDVFRFIEQTGLVDSGEIKVTALIDSVPAAFEMHEILYELREYIVGLACNRTDYAFSYARCFHQQPECVLPDPVDLDLDSPFIASQTKLLVQTCHRRGALAIGNTSNYVLTTNDEFNEFVENRIRNDKERELTLGIDVLAFRQPELFARVRNSLMKPESLSTAPARPSADAAISAGDLLQECRGKITEACVRQCINESVQFVAVRLAGHRDVKVGRRLVRQSTVELARALLWQWVHHVTGILDEGINIDPDYFCTLLREESDRIDNDENGNSAISESIPAAAALLKDLVLADRFLPTMTIPAAIPEL